MEGEEKGLRWGLPPYGSERSGTGGSPPLTFSPIPLPLLSHLTLAGDGWSSRAEDAVLHGCIPVVIMDEVLPMRGGPGEGVGALFLLPVALWDAHLWMDSYDVLFPHVCSLRPHSYACCIHTSSCRCTPSSSRFSTGTSSVCG